MLQLSKIQITDTLLSIMLAILLEFKKEDNHSSWLNFKKYKSEEILEAENM